MNTGYDIETEILNLLGLSLDPSTGRVYDSDKAMFLICHGNYVYTDKSMIIHKNDIKFDIFNNAKFMEYLLNVLIQKESEDNGLYVLMISTMEEETTEGFVKRGISIDSNMGKFISKMYYNMCLAYIEMIYAITGAPLPNLLPYEYDIKLLRERYNNKR